MDDLTHSSGAMSALADLYDAKLLLCVEEAEDMVFWRLLLERIGLAEAVRLRAEGCKDQLRRFIQYIVEGNKEIVVAADSDYDRLEGIEVDHPQVVYGSCSLESS